MTDRVTGLDASAGGNRLHGFSLPALMLLLGASTSTAFAADAMSQSAEFDIPPQSVESALHEFSRQADVQVMVGSTAIEGQRTSGVKGRFSAAAALSKLLQDTNLAYETVGDGNTVTVKRVAAASESTGPAPAQTRSQGEDEPTDAENPAEPSANARDSDNGKPRRSIEEIVVTAQKREEKLQDVPISISVLTGDNLDRSSVRSVTEALNRVPGVVTDVNSGGARLGATPRVIVRGVVPTVGSGTVAYYLDSIPFGATGSPFFSSIAPDPSAYDLERVEVLRGPQGTLYGLSASNGVIRVLTKDANLSEFEGKARALVSGTDHGGTNYRGDLAVNVPIVSDKLAVRAVLGYQDWDGWLDTPIRKDANDAQTSNVRLKVNAQPTEQLSASLFAWLSRSELGAGAVSPDGRRFSSVYDLPSSNDYDAYGVKLGYEFSSFSVTNMTSYLDYRLDTLMDFTVIGIPNNLVTNNADSKVFSDEVILNSTHDGPWRWTLGGIYRDGEVESYTVRTNAITGGFGTSYLAPNIQRNYSESFAVFGELTRSFFDDRLELTGGLRYFEDKIRAREISTQVVVGGIPATGLVDIENKFDSVTPRAVLTWHPNPLATIYASYAEGFRSGISQRFSTERLVPGYPAAESDLLKNYEVGAKGSLFGGRINFDTAVYYMDWQDVQQEFPVLVDGFAVGVALNAGSASGAGFEVGVSVEPADGLTLGASYAWNDLKMDESVLNGVTGALVIGRGQRLLSSPETTAGASADYAFSLGRNGVEARLSMSANYVSRFASGGAATQRIYTDSMWLSRASFGVEFPHFSTVTLFVDNATNENGVLARDSASPEWSARVRPRTVGLQLDHRF